MRVGAARAALALALADAAPVAATEAWPTAFGGMTDPSAPASNAASNAPSYDATSAAQAAAAARASLPLFRKNAFLRNGDGFPTAQVMILLGDAATGTEPIWTHPVRRLPDGNFTAHLAGLPRNLPDYIVGERITFGPDRVLDWSVRRSDGLTYGHFLARAAGDRAAGASVPNASGPLSPKPVPDDW